jgi:diguanylate cyclase (GGDEF)-like protein
MSALHPEPVGPLASVRAQTFTGAAVAVVVLLGILIVLYAFTDRRNALAGGDRIAEQIAEQTALIAEGTFDSARQLLRAVGIVASPPSRGPVDPDLAHAALLRLKDQNPEVMDILVVDAGGRIAHWTGTGTPPDIRDREYYAYHAQNTTSRLYVGEPLISKVHDGRWFVALSEALRDPQGRLEKVVVAMIDNTLLHDRMGTGFALPDSSQTLLSESGTVHARRPGHTDYVGKRVNHPKEMSSLTTSSPAVTVHTVGQLDGRMRILSFRKVAGYPLVAAGTVVIDELLAPWRQRVIFAVALWTLLGGVALVFARRANAISRMHAELASLDSLTGLSNRRSILDTATRLERSHQHAGSLSLLMIDVDHFKSINDRFGHQVGDEVLRRVSDVLRTQVRTTDIVGRYGGEEFLVLMPDTGPEGAVLVAEKLCTAVADGITQPDQVTVSIGVATTSERDLTLDRTLTRADEALYRAKADGRNCVRVARQRAATAAPVPA